MMTNFVSKFFLLLGIGCILIALYFTVLRYNPNRLAFAAYENPPLYIVNSYKPKKLSVPELDIELSVIPSEMSDGKWQSTTRGISYLASSPIPGEKGNSILYGHNFPSLLKDLTKAKSGQKIQIEYSDSSIKYFTIEHTMVVEPNQTSILTNTNDHRVTLYTCTGFLDSKRFVVVAVLDEE